MRGLPPAAKISARRGHGRVAGLDLVDVEASPEVALDFVVMSLRTSLSLNAPRGFRALSCIVVGVSDVDLLLCLGL
jgi:hypothetical protein